MRLKHSIKVSLEELFPVLFYLANTHKIRKRIELQKPERVNDSKTAYYKLSGTDLMRRVSEELERARLMDSKTSKMTLFLSLVMTALGAVSTFLAKNFSSGWIELVILLPAFFSIFYSFSAALVAFGALRTLPSYGYGTEFLVKARRSKTVVIRNLIKQEDMNLLRHLRNECAYQCIRNAFLCLLFVLALFLVISALAQLNTSSFVYC